MKFILRLTVSRIVAQTVLFVVLYYFKIEPYFNFCRTIHFK